MKTDFGGQRPTAYPLRWPDGWRLTHPHERTRARFSERSRRSESGYVIPRNLSVNDGILRVIHELKTMGVREDDIIISTNLVTRLDGLPRSGQAEPSHPGAAVYWLLAGQKGTRCMAIDRYDRVADNLAAIAATLAAMRAIERHGGASILDRVFTGFTALPSPEQWWQVLGFSTARVTAAEIEARYRELAMKHHPDRGGSDHEMARINEARDLGLEAVSS